MDTILICDECGSRNITDDTCDMCGSHAICESCHAPTNWCECRTVRVSEPFRHVDGTAHGAHCYDWETGTGRRRETCPGSVMVTASWGLPASTMDVPAELPF